MNIVPRPEQSPGFCMATMSSEDNEGFIDTGLVPAVVDPRVYISVSYIRECARNLGMVDGSVKEVLERENSRLKSELQEADSLVEAAEYTFQHFGEKLRRKPGPKKVSKES